MSHDLNISKNLWKSEYNIGDLKIDNEHQKLFLLARKAININMSDNKKKIFDNLKNIITELFDYTKTHFAHEEEFMRKLEYVEYEQHKVIHRQITAQLNDLIQELNNLEFSQIKMRVFEFINEKLVKHIITEDKKILIWNTPIEELKKHFGWKEIYSVGDEDIDKEHKKLFDIAQEAMDETAIKNERDTKIKAVLINLYDYMKTHFKHEEELMKEADYPQLQEHADIHNKIIESINTFVKQLPTMRIEIFEKELIRIIDIVLIQHIIQEDRKIINWVKAMNNVVLI